MSRAFASPLRAYGVHRVENPFEGRSNTHRRRALKEVARALPRTPGVYFFYGYNDRLIYIGKANCLRERVRSYFAETKGQRPPKLRRLLAEIERLDYRQCGSELEALLLERHLIAELRPALNRQLKRFEIYPYLLLSDEDFPRFTVTRAEPIRDKETDGQGDAETGEENLSLSPAPRAGELPGLYLGPFTTPRAAYWTMEAVRNFFPLRSCEGAIVPDPQGNACIYHEIGRCSGPCIGAASQQEYSRLVADLLHMLHHGDSPQLRRLKARMEQLAEEWRFEDAAKLKVQLEAIEQVAARLRRLQRMRDGNNLAIVQRGQYSEGEAPCSRVFLVRDGVVHHRLTVTDWEEESAAVRGAVRETFEAPSSSQPFTAKEGLDEMLILDRWLAAHGRELCCAWLNDEDRKNHAWAGNAVRRLRAWARRNIE
jgi:excinuclease UvrABC nuclease subunit